MARILSDREIKTLLKDVIIDGDPNLISPNGIELRLGAKVRFITTNEPKELKEGQFLVVHPGECVLISSLERIDFSPEIIHRHFPKCSLMAMITPTTTMMREGILQSATKVDAGYFGDLNWGFRNSSHKDFIIRRGEPLFKLTLFLLEGAEVPEIHYGEKDTHSYYKTAGIKVSQRLIPATISKEEMIDSSFHKLDPRKQLQEAGHPFNYIGTELTRMDDRLVVVSNDMAALGKKIESLKTDFSEKIDSVFQSKFYLAIGTFTAVIATVWGIITTIEEKTKIDHTLIQMAAIFLGLSFLIFSWAVLYKKKA